MADQRAGTRAGAEVSTEESHLKLQTENRELTGDGVWL